MKQAPDHENHWAWFQNAKGVAFGCKTLSILKIAATCGVCALASGCVMSVMGTAKQPAVDQALRTGAVGTSVAAQPPAETSADMVTIRNAVTSTDLQHAAAQPLAWANAETGSRGIIEKIQQYEDQSRLCRRFEVSRESYSGVALFDGDACVTNSGEWAVRRFEQR